GLENTISNSLNDKLDHSITITGYYQYAEPELKDFYYRNQYNYSLRSKISYKASNKFSGDIQWNYFGNRRSLNIKSDDRGYLNLAARYKTLHNKGTVTLRFTDIFRTNIYESTRRSNNIYEEIMWRGQTRVLVLAFNYRFSKGDITLRKNPSKSYSETGALE
ncbi:MAG: outer membrane beta-barrel protein, partial [Ekhidna sp.]